MSLSKKQITKLIAELSLMQLQDGKLLDTKVIQDKLADILGNNQGLPTLKYKPQKRKRVFNIEGIGKKVERMEFILKILA